MDSIALLRSLGLTALLSLSVAMASAPEESPEFQATWKQGEELWLKNDHSNSRAAFAQARKLSTTNALARALYCRSLYEIGELLPENADAARLKLYDEMVIVAEEGLKADPKSGECMFMRALGRARKANINGILSSLKWGKAIMEDWLNALNTPMGYVSPDGMRSRAEDMHALGLFFREAPDSRLLKWLFGFSGSLAKAEEYSRQAAEIQVDQVEVQLELGVVLVARGLEEKIPAKVAEGKAQIQKVLGMPEKKKTDFIDKRHAKMLLDHPEMCRDYDRTGQQQSDAKDDAIRAAKNKG